MAQTPDQFAAALLAAAAAATAETARVVAKGALNVKNQAKANVQKSAPVHNAYAQGAITYDTPKLGAGTIRSEIGYDKDKRGGALGNLLEYGSRKNGAHRDLGRALDDEEPRFGDSLLAAMTGLLK